VTDRRTAPKGDTGHIVRAVATAAAGLLAALLVSGPAAAAPGGGYGSLPKWLPKQTVTVGRVVTATAAHPWLAVEGDTVRADLSRGHVLVTAVGPAVPEEGAFPVPRTSPCTFTVTFDRGAGYVPLAATAFTITDELGHMHHPHVSLQSGAALPAAVGVGQPLSVTVADVLPTGNGTLHWAPSGRAPLVSWDFDVEID
jgi:hypothetical protein